MINKSVEPRLVIDFLTKDWNEKIVRFGNYTFPKTIPNMSEYLKEIFSQEDLALYYFIIDIKLCNMIFVEKRDDDEADQLRDQLDIICDAMNRKTLNLVNEVHIMTFKDADMTIDKIEKIINMKAFW